MKQDLPEAALDKFAFVTDATGTDALKAAADVIVAAAAAAAKAAPVALAALGTRPLDSVLMPTAARKFGA